MPCGHIGSHRIAFEGFYGLDIPKPITKSELLTTVAHFLTVAARSYDRLTNMRLIVIIEANDQSLRNR